MNQQKKKATKNQSSNNTIAIEDCVIREVRINYQPTREAPFKVSSPETVARFARNAMSDNSREHALALYLDGAHQVTAYATISIGSANNASIHPREIFQRAVVVGAVSLVLVHNHPSGQLQPSAEDNAITERLSEAGKLLGIRLLDHVIVTQEGHYSMRDQGFRVLC